MASTTIWALGVVVLAALVRHYIETLARNRRLRQLQAQHGCGALPITKSRWPWGLDRIVKILRFKGDILDERMHAGFVRQRRWTHAVDGVLTRPTIMTADPRNIQSILATNFKDWGVGARRSKQFGPFLGLGVFTTDGAYWEHARAVVRPQFVREQVSNLDATLRHCDQLFAYLTPDADGWTAYADLMPLISRYTLDTGTEFLFGESVESQRTAGHQISADGAPLSRSNSFEAYFERASNSVAIRMRLGGFYWLINNAGFRRACRHCRDYATYFVDKALRSRREGKPVLNEPASTGKTPSGVFLRGLAEATQDRTEICDQLLQLLFAGRDTTASLISFALLCLSRHPAVWARLRAEVHATFGTYDAPKADFTFAGLKSCPTLQNILQETLRMFPPISMNTREALRDTVLPTGGGSDQAQPIAVAKGTIVNYSCYVLQRRTDLWGSDAGEWKPERWAGRKFGFDYIPFNGGPRICPGQQFALTEVGLTLARMAQVFDAIECKDADQPIRKKLGLTISPKNGVYIRLHRASSL